ncbi:General stress protein 69 [Peribacillus sp. Bi96]|nr:General stress protein 69 [Peribacillus sp. Bi96]
MGESEKILGRALKDYTKRDDIVLATKVHQTMRPGRPNSGGLSRKEIMTEIDHSLERLGTDYVDYILFIAGIMTHQLKKLWKLYMM